MPPEQKDVRAHVALVTSSIRTSTITISRLNKNKKKAGNNLKGLPFLFPTPNSLGSPPHCYSCLVCISLMPRSLFFSFFQFLFTRIYTVIPLLVVMENKRLDRNEKKTTKDKNNDRF